MMKTTQVLFLIFFVPTLVLAQATGPVAPAPAPAVPAPAVPAAAAPAPAPAPVPAPPPPGANLSAEIELLKTQINQFKGNVATVKGNVATVSDTATKLYDTVESYPQQVTDFKTKYGIPAKPTVEQELTGIGRALMDKAGLDAKQSNIVEKSVKGAADRARTFKPLAPESIMLSVGVAAGMSVLSHVASTGKLDLKESLSFLGDKGFWAGLAGSSVGYAAAAYAISAFLPPGTGLVAAFLPTFGALTASILGGEIASKGVQVGFKQAFSRISIAEIIGQAAGSTLGMFVGANVISGLAATLGSAAGPIGTILGGIIGGQIGLWVVRTLKGLVTGTLSSAPGAQALEGELAAPSGTRANPALPAGSILPAATLKGLQDSYRAEYGVYVGAQKSGDKKSSTASYQRLTAIKGQYELAVRQLVSTMKNGHQPAPTR
ncbi:MAG: hypothetical protein HY815_24270 [Candidatus Riflebacteria bacterium]|nr:hypothetical protein [Candidatus Riflebacteria bacterium]